MRQDGKVLLNCIDLLATFDGLLVQSEWLKGLYLLELPSTPYFSF